jgi:hypothetical protein
MVLVRLAVALALFVVPALAEADPRPRVAVVPGLAVNIDSARADALAQDLADALATELDIEAFGGLEVRRKLPAEGIADDCFTRPECTSDVARRLAANQLLFVVMIDATGSGAVQLDVTWVDPETQQSASRPAIDLPAGADPKPRLAAAARQLLPDAPVRSKPTSGTLAGTMSPEIPRHFTTASYVTAGAGVAGLGLGIALGLSARSKYNACEESGLCRPGGSERDAIRTRTILADASLVVGVAGIVATGVLYMTSGKESRLIVSPSAEGVAISAFGRF